MIRLLQLFIIIVALHSFALVYSQQKIDEDAKQKLINEYVLNRKRNVTIEKSIAPNNQFQKDISSQGSLKNKNLTSNQNKVSTDGKPIIKSIDVKQNPIDQSKEDEKVKPIKKYLESKQKTAAKNKTATPIATPLLVKKQSLNNAPASSIKKTTKPTPTNSSKQIAQKNIQQAQSIPLPKKEITHQSSSSIQTSQVPLLTNKEQNSSQKANQIKENEKIRLIKEYLRSKPQSSIKKNIKNDKPIPQWVKKQPTTVPPTSLTKKELKEVIAKPSIPVNQVANKSDQQPITTTFKNKENIQKSPALIQSKKGLSQNSKAKKIVQNTNRKQSNAEEDQKVKLIKEYLKSRQNSSASNLNQPNKNQKENSNKSMVTTKEKALASASTPSLLNTPKNATQQSKSSLVQPQSTQPTHKTTIASFQPKENISKNTSKRKEMALKEDAKIKLIQNYIKNKNNTSKVSTTSKPTDESLVDRKKVPTPSISTSRNNSNLNLNKANKQSIAKVPSPAVAQNQKNYPVTSLQKPSSEEDKKIQLINKYIKSKQESTSANNVNTTTNTLLNQSNASGKSASKDKTIGLLNTMFNEGAYNKDAILFIKNRTVCTLDVNIKGNSSIYRLQVPANDENFIVLNKEKYLLSGILCNQNFSLTKDLQKSTSITLSLR